MADTIPPGGPPVELALAQLANEAMKRGADPQAVTLKLHDVIGHLRAHPELMQDAQDALTQGIDPNIIAAKTYQHLQQQGQSGVSFGAEPPAPKASPAPAKTGAMEYMAESVPFVSKATALANAGIDKAEGAPSFWDAYDKRLESLQAGQKQYESENPRSKTLALGVAGNVLPAVATMGGSVAEEAAPGLLSTVLRGANTGMKMGALQGLSQAHSSGTAPKVSDYVNEIAPNALLGAVLGGGTAGLGVGAVGAARRMGLPELVSNSAATLASKAKPGSAASQVLENAANMFGTRGEAVAKLAPRVQEDIDAGFQAPQAPAGVPELPIDRAGPSVRGQAGGIANNTGAGRGILTSVVEQRGKAMRPDLEGAFDQGTGTTTAEGEKLLTDLADQQSALDKATAQAEAIGKEVKKVQGAKVPMNAPPAPLVAWRQEMGGSLANGIQALRQYVSDRTAEAHQLFGAAKAATNGQPMQSPTLDQVLQTPVGRWAYRMGVAQKLNRGGSLPAVEVAGSGEDSPLLQAALELGIPRDKAIAALGTTERESVPDPETLHYTKQWLAKAARLGVNDGAQGTISTEAQGALQNWAKIRSEMPAIWQQADAAFAKRSRVIDALNAGRNIIRTQLNPAGMKALHQSLDAVQDQIAKASPEEQAAFRIGAQSAITDMLRSKGASARALTAQLSEPTSALSRKVALATGDAQAPARLAQRLTPTVNGPQLIPAAPPTPNASPEMQATARGLGILGNHVSDENPNNTLAVLDRDVAALSPATRQQFQKAAAQAVRGKMQASTDNQLPGIFDKTPERNRQMGLAFPNPQAAQDFQSRADFWQRARDLENQLTGNSQTAVRGAEQAASAETHADRSALKQAFTGHPRQALGTLINQNETAAQRATREKVDAMIARMMVGKNPNALTDAVMQNQLRKSLGARSSYLLPAILAGAGTTDR